MTHHYHPEEFIDLDLEQPSVTSETSHKLSSKKRTVVNIFKSYVGAGVLAIPYAFAQGGLVVSIICYLVVAAVALYCMLLLLKVKRHILQHRASPGSFELEPSNNKPTDELTSFERNEGREESVEDDEQEEGATWDSRSDTTLISNSTTPNPTEDDESRISEAISFEEVGEYIFGWWGKFLVDLCLLSSQLGFCVVYQIFLGDTINTLIPRIPKIACLFLTLPILISVCQIRRLKWLAVTSLVALGVFLFGFLVILFFSIQLTGFGRYAPRFMGPTSLSSFATMVSFAVFSFEGIGLVLPLENAIQRDSAPLFTRLFSASVGAVTLIYTLVGAIGYACWGLWVRSSLLVNVMGSLRPAWGVLVSVGFLIGGFCSYPLNMHPVTTRLEALLLLADINGNDNEQVKWVQWKRTALRTGLVLLALILALAIPSFGLFISLVGALFSTPLAFIFPTLFHIKVFSWPSQWPSTPLNLSKSQFRAPSTGKGLTYRQYAIAVFDIAVCVFGVLATIVCTVVSVQNIIVAIRNGNIAWSFQSKI